MGEAERRETGGGVGLVADSVPELLDGRAVVAQAVGLDHQTEVWPVEVDLEPVHPLACEGRGQTRAFGDGEEEALEVRVGEGEGLTVEDGGEEADARDARELVVGRRCVWLPDRWKRVEMGGKRRTRFTKALLKRIRWIERYSRPRLGGLLRGRLSGAVFGLIVLVLTVFAFVAPPFSGLDTLPSLGVVVLSLGILLEDVVAAIAGVVIGAVGVVLVLALGSLILNLL